MGLFYKKITPVIYLYYLSILKEIYTDHTKFETHRNMQNMILCSCLLNIMSLNRVGPLTRGFFFPLNTSAFQIHEFCIYRFHIRRFNQPQIKKSIFTFPSTVS